MSAKIIAFFNGKGGCGKSTTIFHTAGEFAKRNKKVLVVDLDKQHNTTDTFLRNLSLDEHVEISNTLFDVLVGNTNFEDVVHNTYLPFRKNTQPKYIGIDVLPSDNRFEKQQEQLENVFIKDEFDAFVKSQKYDYVLIDMPPSHKHINDICFQQMADYVIVPFSSDLHSVTGYGDLMETVNEARELNPNLKILGVFLSRFMGHCEVDKFIKEELQGLGDMFIDIQIPVRADIREGVMFGKPMCYYKPSSKSTVAFEKLVTEINKRIKQNR